MEPYSYYDNEIRNIYTVESKTCSIHDLPIYDIQRIRVVYDGSVSLCFDGLLPENTICHVTSDQAAIIVNKNATKEQALITVSDYLNVSVDHVIAFGDEINDVGMLTTAGTGIAMGNAVDAVKKSAIT